MTSPAARPDDFAQGPTKPQATTAPTSMEAPTRIPTNPPTPKKTGERYNLKVQVAKRPRTPNFKGGDSICGMKYAPKAKRPEATPNFNRTLAWRTASAPSACMDWMVLAVAVPVGKRNFSSTTIWLRNGTA